MQQHAPEAVDFSTGDRRRRKELYGIDEPQTADFGRKCLLARRLVERGVRFIQLYSGGAHNDDNWDAHGDLVKNHTTHAGRHRQADRRPAQGPEAPRPARRDADRLGRRVRPPADRRVRHRAPAATTTPTASRCGWPAAASRAASASARPTNSAPPPSTDRFHVKNLHATILHQLGLDPNRLTLLLRRPGPEAGRRRRGGADQADDLRTETNHRGTETQRRQERIVPKNSLLVFSVSLCLCG